MALRKQFRPSLIPAAHPVEIGEVDQRGNEIRVEPQGRAVFRLRRGQLMAPQVQQAEIEMRLGPLGIDHLGSDQFAVGAVQGSRCAGVSACGSTPASARAASMRTARTGSLSSGAAA